MWTIFVRAVIAMLRRMAPGVRSVTMAVLCVGCEEIVLDNVFGATSARSMIDNEETKEGIESMS